MNKHSRNMISDRHFFFLVSKQMFFEDFLDYNALGALVQCTGGYTDLLQGC